MSAHADALHELHRQLEACAAGVETLETLVLELIGRAGAQGDAGVIERAQAVDALAQQLRRLSSLARDLAGGEADLGPLNDSLAVLARRLSPSNEAGEMDLF